MRFLRKHPSLFGWLPLYLLAHMLASLFVLYVVSLLSKQGTKEFEILTLSVTPLVFLIFNFVLFLLSIKVAVFPIYQIGKEKVAEPKQITLAHLTSKWFNYFVDYFMFSFPVTYVFSALDIDNFVTTAWPLIASYIAFRLVIHPWMKEAATYSHPADSEGTVPA